MSKIAHRLLLAAGVVFVAPFVIAFALTLIWIACNMVVDVIPETACQLGYCGLVDCSYKPWRAYRGHDVEAWCVGRERKP